MSSDLSENYEDDFENISEEVQDETKKSLSKESINIDDDSYSFEENTFKNIKSSLELSESDHSLSKYLP